ncbi:multidrug efflux pump subunit AcrA (membrane-fusion protein) [Chromobacterium alkanivorans]|uniref:DUF4124 domain-containing protein n=1 Tax=Chromobacterium alkanivorans TaxID=1071719 RepID=UPI002167E4D9|nr:DUF4124 domain-containing protein [Chromobacterium alkanivorans]MCS3802448.1 multidrug efflux pump subunit AcrA (membrane-fusion protein) [Chromobacterium alkanivorans]MCS3816774.1 multidrug efflux pump subunit AcrA (membrane-fusion protein) [Chromobacterium alkanivorans]MCS3871814.1 multidrug efflux pump subunit AcrA (membrane-fusion protein) [Chromobacterium alkanivorans]
MRTRIALLLLLPGLAWAQVYKCRNAEGGLVYSDRACADGGAAEAFRPPPLNVVEQDERQRRGVAESQARSWRRAADEAAEDRRRQAQRRRAEQAQARELDKARRRCHGLELQQRRLRQSLAATPARRSLAERLAGVEEKLAAAACHQFQEGA